MKYSSVLFFVCLSLALYVVSSTNSPCDVLGLESRYDVIVVGSGPGGSVSARRLAEYGGGRLKVLLVERGLSYTECPGCSEPKNFFTYFLNDTTGPNIPFAPQVHIPGNPIYNGKWPAINGGGTMLNGMAFIRGDSPYYWDHFWPVNWSFLDVIPYLEKTETYHFQNGFYGPDNNFNYAANLRGNHGLLPVTSTDAAYGNGYTGLFVDKSKIVWPNIPAYKNNSLNNGFFPGHGVAPPDHSWSFIDGNKVRSDSYTTYVKTYTGSNLKSIVHVRVNKILFSGTTVTGVQLVFVNSSLQATSSTCTVSTSTVISSGGQFATPQLLKLSGVGPRAELESFGIPVIVDSPLVGTHYSDQFQISLTAKSTDVTTVPGPDYDNFGLLFWNVDDNPFEPDNFGINLVNTQSNGQTVAMFITSIGYTDSKGTVTLASANPDDIPIVDPNYLSTTRDKNNIAKAVNQTIQLISKMGLELSPDPCATSDCSTLESLLNTLLLGGFGHPGNHMTGTCSLGRVVDPYTMKVYGTTGLYIVDASAAPEGPNENSQNTVYALAERGIQFVILDHVSRFEWL